MKLFLANLMSLFVFTSFANAKSIEGQSYDILYPAQLLRVDSSMLDYLKVVTFLKANHGQIVLQNFVKENPKLEEALRFIAYSRATNVQILDQTAKQTALQIDQLLSQTGKFKLGSVK